MFSIIIPNHRRTDVASRLINLLVETRKSRGLEFEIIMVDYDNPEIITMDEVRVIPCTPYPCDGPFCLSHARNIGALAARTDWLVFLDADLKPHNNAIFRISQVLKNGKPNTLYYATRKKLSPQLSDIGTNTEPWGYCQIIHREKFFALNGYNEKFRGWGGEDGDIVDRAKLMGMTTQAIDGCLFFHPWHEEATWMNSGKLEDYKMLDNGYTVDQVIRFEGDAKKYLDRITDLEKKIEDSSAWQHRVKELENQIDQLQSDNASIRRDRDEAANVRKTLEAKIIKLEEKMRLDAQQWHLDVQAHVARTISLREEIKLVERDSEAHVAQLKATCDMLLARIETMSKLKDKPKLVSKLWTYLTTYKGLY